MKTQSQESQILDYLKSGRSLTPIQALVKFGSFRLSGRIHRLREQGHPIKTEIIETESEKRVAKYSYIY